MVCGRTGWWAAALQQSYPAHSPIPHSARSTSTRVRTQAASRTEEGGQGLRRGGLQEEAKRQGEQRC